jgi:hypothetical protein
MRPAERQTSIPGEVRMRNIRVATLVGLLLLVLTTLAVSEVILDVFEPEPGDPDLALGQYTHPAGGPTLDLSIGIGSGAFRSPFDPLPLLAFLFGLRRNPIVDAVWTVSDRGPNIECEEAEAVIGLDDDVACPADGTVESGVGRIYPRPDYSPSIYRVALRRDGTFRIARAIPLRTANGTPITGLPNPLTVATTEVPRDGTGTVIAQNASAVDAEALVRVPLFGGRFLIGEENGPSLLEVKDDGRIIKRFVPAGTETDYTSPPLPLAPAGYAVDGSLPAILAKRRLNRGIESLAISPDLRFVYFVMQSPLDNPGSSVRDSANIRLFKLRVHWHAAGSRLEPVGEWVYPLEQATVFQALGATDAGRRRDLRVSEMLKLRGERFLILERTDQVTILFEVDLATGTNILGSSFDAIATTPSLEQMADLASVGITPLAKSQRLIASSLAGAQPRFPAKLEALALSHGGRLTIINDDDFGITGARTRISVVDGPNLAED